MFEVRTPDGDVYVHVLFRISTTEKNILKAILEFLKYYCKKYYKKYTYWCKKGHFCGTNPNAEHSSRKRIDHSEDESLLQPSRYVDWYCVVYNGSLRNCVAVKEI